MTSQETAVPVSSAAARAASIHFWRLLLAQHFALELIFNSLVFWSFSISFGPFDSEAWSRLLASLAALLLLKNLIAVSTLAWLSAPLRMALSRPASELSNTDLERALSSLPRLMTGYTLVMTAIWMLVFGGLFALLPFVHGANFDPPARSLGMILGILGALFWGPIAIYPWQLSLIANRCCEDLASTARQRSLPWRRSAWTLAAKVVGTVVAVFLVCLTWSSALLIRLSQDRDIEHGKRLAHHILNDRFEAQSPNPILLGDPTQAANHPDPRLKACYQTPAGRSLLEQAFKTKEGLHQELRQFQSTICLERQASGQVQVRFAAWDIPVSQDDHGKIGIFAVTLFVYCALVALYVVLSLGRSLQRLQRSCEDHLLRGHFKDADLVPSLEGDEMGRLTESINEVILQLRESAGHVAVVAQGDLSHEVLGSGDLDAALRSMTDSLRSVVAELRGESNRLASRSESLQSMTVEQDEVLAKQARAVAEVDRVALAISSDSAAASATLADIERRAAEARQAAADVLTRTQRLDQSLEAVTSASQVIRKIARRARVLALNAAVEAERGSQGTGEGVAVLAREARELSKTIFTETETFAELSRSIQGVAEACKLAAKTSHGASEETAEASVELRRIVETVRERGEELGTSSLASQRALQGVQESIADAHSVAEELATQALQLRSQLEIFRLPSA